MKSDLNYNIISNYKDLTESSLKTNIIRCLKDKNKDTLYEMGVLFEIIWKEANPTERKQFVKYIKNNIKKHI